MTHSEYLLEVSVLSTILFSHHQCEDETYFNNVELREDMFSFHFHKLVVKQINHNKALGLPIGEEFISLDMATNGTLNNQFMLAIMAANPFSKSSFMNAINRLSSPKLSLSSEV